MALDGPQQIQLIRISDLRDNARFLGYLEQTSSNPTLSRLQTRCEPFSERFDANEELAESNSAAQIVHGGHEAAGALHVALEAVYAGETLAGAARIGVFGEFGLVWSWLAGRAATTVGSAAEATRHRVYCVPEGP